MTDTVPPCDALQQAHVGGDDPRGALIPYCTYLPAVVCQPRCTTWHGQFLDGSAKVEAIFVCARAVICGCESRRLGGAWHCWFHCDRQSSRLRRLWGWCVCCKWLSRLGRGGVSRGCQWRVCGGGCGGWSCCGHVAVIEVQAPAEAATRGVFSTGYDANLGLEVAEFVATLFQCPRVTLGAKLALHRTLRPCPREAIVCLARRNRGVGFAKVKPVLVHALVGNVIHHGVCGCIRWCSRQCLSRCFGWCFGRCVFGGSFGWCVGWLCGYGWYSSSPTRAHLVGSRASEPTARFKREGRTVFQDAKVPFSINDPHGAFFT